MKAIALIPARYNASRFPGKLMSLLGGKTVILRTYEATCRAGLFDEVCVVTDSSVIYDEIINHGGKALMSLTEHECGSDRIAEAASHFPDADLIVNVQGDEPFTRREPLEALLDVFSGPDADQIDLASLIHPMEDLSQIDDPNFVKVVVDRHFFALMFSRSRIPYPRAVLEDTVYYEHVGVYAFRREALLEFSRTPMGMLERAEKIECLRYLENGRKMKMVVIPYMGVEIDTPDDLLNAEKYLQQTLSGQEKIPLS